MARRAGAGAAAAMVSVAILLGVVGSTAAATAPASADIFGIGTAVENFLCGIVEPDEPWEAVGDGPEGFLSNRNLAGVEPYRGARVYGTHDGKPVIISLGDSGLGKQDGPPELMDQVHALPGTTEDYTLYEIAGLRGLNWVTIPLTPDGKERNCSVWAYLWTTAANGLFSVNKVGLQMIIAIKEAASVGNPLGFLYNDTNSTVTTLFTVVFVPIAILMMMFSAIWAGTQVLRGQGARTAIGTALIAAGLGFFVAFLYGALTPEGSGFRTILKTVDGAISGANDMISQVLMNEMTDSGGLCSLPDTADVPQRGQRLTSCVLADALGYRPWAVGQFGQAGSRPIPLPEGQEPQTLDGTTPITAVSWIESVKELSAIPLPCYVPYQECQELRGYLIAQHGGVSVGDSLSGINGYAWCDATMSGFELEMFGGMKIPVKPRALCSPMYATFQALAARDYSTAAAFAGDVGPARVTQALMANLGMLVAGIAVLMTALVTMMWHGKTFALWLIGPVKLAFAVTASKFKLATEWAGDIVQAWLCRLAYGVLLTVVIMLLYFVMQSDLSFGMRLLWLGGTLFMLWKIVGKLQGMLRPGAAAADFGSSSQQVMSKSGRATKNVLQGGTRRVGATGQATFAAAQRRRELKADPNRGALRRKAAPLLTPLSVASAGLEAGVTGSAAGARNRRDKTAAKIDQGMLRKVVKPGDSSEKKTRSTKKQPSTGQTSGAVAQRAKQVVNARDVATPIRRKPANPAEKAAAPKPGYATTADKAPDKIAEAKTTPGDTGRPAGTPTTPAAGPSRATPAASTPQRAAPPPVAPDGDRNSTPSKDPGTSAKQERKSSTAQPKRPDPVSATDGPADAQLRWKASTRVPDLTTADTPERISTEPDAAVPAPALY